MPNGLEAADRAAKLSPLRRVLARKLEHRGRRAHPFRGGGLGVRDGREVRADRARDERLFHYPETAVSADLERPELDEALPEAIGRLARQQLLDGLRKPALLLGELEVHALTPAAIRG